MSILREKQTRYVLRSNTSPAGNYKVYVGATMYIILSNAHLKIQRYHESTHTSWRPMRTRTVRWTMDRIYDIYCNTMRPSVIRRLVYRHSSVAVSFEREKV